MVSHKNSAVSLFGCLVAVLVFAAPASAGVIPLTFDPVGGDPIVDSGWEAIVPDATVSGIVVDAITPGSDVRIQIDKNFLFPPDVGGVFPAIQIIFSQTLPDAQTVPQIVIEDESITNQTGVDWTDFHWVVLDGGSVWFNVAASTPFDTSPFVNQSFVDNWGFGDANKATDLNVDGGLVANGGGFFPGIAGLGGALTIEFDLASENSEFFLKEFPTPEPTTLAFLAFGSIGLVARRRRRS
jgi:hypothetical protein